MGYTAETIKMSGGALKTSLHADDVVLELADVGITATNSSGVLTVTPSSVTTIVKLEQLVRKARALNCKIAYVPSTNV